jgi:hypothetical protein
MPLFARQRRGAHAPVRAAVLAVAAEDEGTGVARIVQDLPRAIVGERSPDQLSLARTAARTTREEQLLVPERLDRCTRGSGAAKGLEEMTQTVLDLLIRVQHDSAGRVVDESNRQRHGELPTTGFVQKATPESCP